MERHVEGLLARDVLAPSSARKLVAQTLDAWGCGEVVDDAVLLVDELVVNVLEHVDHGVIQVDVRADHRVVRVDVSDPEPDFVEDHRRPRQEFPRVGLRIVDTLASRWGVVTSGVGKSVWFELDLVPVGQQSARPPEVDGRRRSDGRRGSGGQAGGDPPAREFDSVRPEQAGMPVPAGARRG